MNSNGQVFLWIYMFSWSSDGGEIIRDVRTFRRSITNEVAQQVTQQATGLSNCREFLGFCQSHDSVSGPCQAVRLLQRIIMKENHFWISSHGFLLPPHPLLESTGKHSALIACCLDKNRVTCKHARQMRCGWHTQPRTIC